MTGSFWNLTLFRATLAEMVMGTNVHQTEAQMTMSKSNKKVNVESPN